jgi:hypothetical protein
MALRSQAGIIVLALTTLLAVAPLASAQSVTPISREPEGFRLGAATDEVAALLRRDWGKEYVTAGFSHDVYPGRPRDAHFNPRHCGPIAPRPVCERTRFGKTDGTGLELVAFGAHVFEITIWPAKGPSRKVQNGYILKLLTEKYGPGTFVPFTGHTHWRDGRTNLTFTGAGAGYQDVGKEVVGRVIYTDNALEREASKATTRESEKQEREQTDASKRAPRGY